MAGSGGATGTATVTESGYTINGYWKHASGALHATAFTANCVLEKEGRPLLASDGSPQVRAFVLKKEEVNLHNTWNAMGMMATGSHAFEAKEVDIPHNRCFIIAPEHVQLSAPLYQYPFLQLAETTLAVNLSGMAMRFLDLCTAYAERKAQGHATSSLLKLAADAHTHLNHQRQSLYEATNASWVMLLQKGSIHSTLLAQVSTASKALVHQCRHWVNTLFPYCGLEAADQHSEFNRVWRNFHTAGQHALFSQELHQD